MCLFLYAFIFVISLTLTRMHQKRCSVAWRYFVCHMKVITSISLLLEITVSHYIFFVQVIKLPVLVSIMFSTVIENFKYSIGTTSFSSQAPNAKKQNDSVGCLQPSHITLIDTTWLHRRLSTHSVCLVVESFWPSIDSTYSRCHLVDQFPLHSIKLNATPPLGNHSMSKFHMDDGGGGALIISPMLRIDLPAKHYSNQKHNLLNVCIHQPRHLC